MGKLDSRLDHLEKQANEQPSQRPQIIEVWGSRVNDDGTITRYLIETRKRLIQADGIDSPQWEIFAGGPTDEHS